MRLFLLGINLCRVICNMLFVKTHHYTRMVLVTFRNGLPFGTAPTDAAYSRMIFIACMRYRKGRPANASRRESYVWTEFMTNGIRS